MQDTNAHRTNAPHTKAGIIIDLQEMTPITPSRGRGVGLHLVDTPVLLVNAWRYGLDERTIVERVVALNRSSADEVSVRLDAAIQDHLAIVMTDTHIAHLFRQRLANQDLTESDMARFTEVLWHQLYAWEPCSPQSREYLEAAVFARLRRILA